MPPANLGGHRLIRVPSTVGEFIDRPTSACVGEQQGKHLTLKTDLNNGNNGGAATLTPPVSLHNQAISTTNRAIGRWTVSVGVIYSAVHADLVLRDRLDGVFRHLYRLLVGLATLAVWSGRKKDVEMSRCAIKSWSCNEARKSRTSANATDGSLLRSLEPYPKPEVRTGSSPQTPCFAGIDG